MARYVTQFELAIDIDSPRLVEQLVQSLQSIRDEHNVDVSARRVGERLLVTVWIELDAPGARNASDSAWHSIRQASVDAEAATTPHQLAPHPTDYMPGWLTLGKVDVRHVIRPTDPDDLDETTDGAWSRSTRTLTTVSKAPGFAGQKPETS